MAQGFHGVGWWLLTALAAPAWAACDGPGGRLHPLGPGAWWIEAALGETSETNRGATANLWAVRDGRRLWLVGGAGTPVLARQVACQLRAAGAGRVTDVVLPWPHAELTLGATGFVGVRLWAHQDTATAMQARCPRCVERMAMRLGAAAADLGPQPIPRPTQWLRGASGRMGPFDWWLLPRAPDTGVLVMRRRGQALWAAPGLAWGEGPPDLRDGDPLLMAQSLQHLAQRLTPGALVVPEQGPLIGVAQVRGQQQGLRQLVDAVDAALRRGSLVTDPPPPGFDGAHPRQSLNWQRTWALREAEVF
jgi:hypothetical protein